MPGSDTAEMPRSKSCRRPPTSASRLTMSTSSRPAATASPHACSRLGARSRRRFETMSCSVVEIDADERIAAVVVFDLDDFDAAIAELDARYLAGEAAAHAHTWSVITRGLRRAQPARTSPDDARLGEHRPPARGTFAPGDLSAYSAPDGTTRLTSASTSRLCIG